jgi:hypothetical protein
MTRRRAIKGILHNFLGTYTSRYSELNGYWLFGFLVEDIQPTRIDLMSTNYEESNMPMSTAKRLAVRKFTEQIEKANIPISWFGDVFLEITKSPSPTECYVNGRLCIGYEMNFVANAVTDKGKLYKSTSTIIVAPHNSKLELQSRHR